MENYRVRKSKLKSTLHLIIKFNLMFQIQSCMALLQLSMGLDTFLIVLVVN